MVIKMTRTQHGVQDGPRTLAIPFLSHIHPHPCQHIWDFGILPFLNFGTKVGK